jgi:hypothetical protein
MPQFTVNGIFNNPILTSAKWHWNTTVSPAVVLGYSQQVFDVTGVDQLTKTGLMPQDVQNYAGVPLTLQGLTPVPLATEFLINLIRQAEDEVEQETGVLLAPTTVAAPPEHLSAAADAAGLLGGAQLLGVNYDIPETPYVFDYKRFVDEGWGVIQAYHRPLTEPLDANVAEENFTSIKNLTYIYPLLNQFFRIPTYWLVENRKMGMANVVPSQNIQMLPLFSMQIALLGFAESIPGGMHMVYEAGLNPPAYQNEYSFVKQLVAYKAVVNALSIVQGTLNVGAIERKTEVDGLMHSVKYNMAPYAGLIASFNERITSLTHKLIDLVAGPDVEFL